MRQLLSFRWGNFALVLWWYNRSAWSVQKWSYQGRSSWQHGTAYLWRFKVAW